MKLTLPVGLALALSFAGLASSADPISDLSKQGRVVLVPLNLAVAASPELAPGVAAVWEQLVARFKDQQPAPASLERAAATALWTDVVKTLEPGDGPEALYAAYSAFARRVAEQVDFGAIVIPTLITRSAEIRGRQASWDGVHRLIDPPRLADAPGAGTGAEGLISTGIRGALGAASLHLAVLGPDGEIRLEGTGGLALLQRFDWRGKGGAETLVVVEDPAPFGDADALRDGIEVAFARARPRALPAAPAN